MSNLLSKFMYELIEMEKQKHTTCNDTKKFDSKEMYDYGDAVAAIMNSDMYSTDKETAVSKMDCNADSSIYKAIISIAKSETYSSTKRSMIEKMFS